jgi:hypothetical protein
MASYRARASDRRIGARVLGDVPRDGAATPEGSPATLYEWEPLGIAMRSVQPQQFQSKHAAPLSVTFLCALGR